MGSAIKKKLFLHRPRVSRATRRAFLHTVIRKALDESKILTIPSHFRRRGCNDSRSHYVLLLFDMHRPERLSENIVLQKRERYRNCRIQICDEYSLKGFIDVIIALPLFSQAFQCPSVFRYILATPPIQSERESCLLP